MKACEIHCLYVLGYKFVPCVLTFQTYDVIVGLLGTVAKVRMHKNTPCTVFSALNKICCILL